MNTFLRSTLFTLRWTATFIALYTVFDLLFPEETREDEFFPVISGEE